MIHVWTVLCTKSIVDRLSNNLTLVEVMERISGPSTPEQRGIMALEMDFVSLWARTELNIPEKRRARFRILGANGTQLGHSPTYDVDLSSAIRLRNTTRLPGIPYSGNGYQFFVVELEDSEDEWKEVARIPLEVILDAPVLDTDEAPVEEVPTPGIDMLGPE